MGFEPVLFGGRPCDLPRLCCEHVSVCVVCPLLLPFINVRRDVVKAIGRAIGLDVHLDFCEIAVCEDGKVRSAGRVASTPEALKVLAESLLPSDRVALEVTGSAWASGSEPGTAQADRPPPPADTHAPPATAHTPPHTPTKDPDDIRTPMNSLLAVDHTNRRSVHPDSSYQN
jgi:hypothetical protein